MAVASLFGHAAQWTNGFPAIVATKMVGPLGRDRMKMGGTGPRPIYQGVALRWKNCWAFGPKADSIRTDSGVFDKRNCGNRPSLSGCIPVIAEVDVLGHGGASLPSHGQAVSPPISDMNREEASYSRGTSATR